MSFALICYLNDAFGSQRCCWLFYMFRRCHMFYTCVNSKPVQPVHVTQNDTTLNRIPNLEKLKVNTSLYPHRMMWLCEPSCGQRFACRKLALLKGPYHGKLISPLRNTIWPYENIAECVMQPIPYMQSIYTSKMPVLNLLLLLPKKVTPLNLSCYSTYSWLAPPIHKELVSEWATTQGSQSQQKTFTAVLKTL